MTVQTTAQDQARERRNAWIVWGALIGVTLAGWLLTDREDGGTAVIVLIGVFAFGKCWLIVQHFMEVRHAPRWLQVVTTCWMAILCTTLVVLFVRA